MSDTYEASGPRYYVVIGLHRVHRIPATSEVEALKVADQLRRSGFEVRIEPTTDLQPIVPQLPDPTPTTHEPNSSVSS